MLSDDTQKRYAQEIQGFQASEVAKQLEDFRWEWLFSVSLKSMYNSLPLKKKNPTNDVLSGALFVFVFITKANHQPACATLILLPSNRGQKIACHCGQSGLTAQSVVILMQGWLLHSSFLFSFFIVFRRLPKFEGRIFVSLENSVARPKGVPQSYLEEIIYFRTGPAV